VSEAQRLWSVTTLARLGLGTSEPLVNWAVRTTGEAAYDKIKILREFVDAGDRDGAVKWLTDQRWQTSGKAAARGTDLHTAAEQLALGQTPKVEEHIQPYLDQYVRFLELHAPEFLMAEAPVYNPTFGYAGTCDGVIVLDGKRLVFDIKTTKHGPNSGKSRPPFSEVALQLVAYRRAELVGILAERHEIQRGRYYGFRADGTYEPMPETEGAVCLVVSPEDFLCVPVRTDDVVWRHFRHVMENARWQVEVSRNVFGPAITAPAREEIRT
jgi:hypothetical protein